MTVEEAGVVCDVTVFVEVLDKAVVGEEVDAYEEGDEGVEGLDVAGGTNGELVCEFTGALKLSTVSRAAARSFGEDVRADGEGLTSATEEVGCEPVDRVEDD